MYFIQCRTDIYNSQHFYNSNIARECTIDGNLRFFLYYDEMQFLKSFLLNDKLRKFDYKVKT